MELLMRCVFRIFKPDDVAMSVIRYWRPIDASMRSFIRNDWNIARCQPAGQEHHICDVPYLEIIITVGHDSMS